MKRLLKYPIENMCRHYWGTIVHKFWVFTYCTKLSARIFWRGIVHDNSKFRLDECEGFFSARPLKDLKYGTKKYDKNLEEIEELKLHYARNSHHPNFYKKGIKGFDLADLCEMFCDWLAAVRRTNKGDINKSISVNKKRFEMSDDLTSIFKNESKE